MSITAVVDRLEDDVAVLLVGPDERRVDFPAEYLPAAREGNVLTISIEVDNDEETRMRERAKVLLEKLKANRQ